MSREFRSKVKVIFKFGILAGSGFTAHCFFLELFRQKMVYHPEYSVLCPAK